MKNIINEKKGITLISLIITIIIMLILAGVSIKVAVDDNFIGKAENANAMNENAIDRAEINEEEALKGNVDDFNAYEEIERDFIEVYELKNVTYNQLDNNGNIIKDSDYTIQTLSLINESLSKYIEEKGITNLYFKVSNSNRKSLVYTVDKDEISFELKEEYVNEDGDTKIVTKGNTVEEGFEKKNTILEVRNITIDDLEDLTIDAKKDENSSSLAKLTFRHNEFLNSELQDDIIYIPKGSTSELVLEDGAYKINNKNLLDKKVVGCYTNEENKSAKLSNKTISNIEGCTVSTSDGKSEINTAGTGVTTNYDPITKLYIVQELVDGYDRTIYMDDFECEIYSPIATVEITNPQNLSYILPEKNAEEVISVCKDAQGEIIDVATKTVYIINNEGNEDDDVVVTGGSFVLTSDNKKIYSTVTNIPGQATEDRITLKVIACDYGGEMAECTKTIKLASDKFILKVDEEEVGYFGTLSSAINGIKMTIDGKEEIEYGAKWYLDPKNGYAGSNVTIVQNTDNYQIEESLFETQRVDNPDNGITTYNKFFVIDSSLNGLTYDLNGFRLLCIVEGKPTMMKIEEGVTFTLQSNRLNDDDGVRITYEKDGIFDFTKEPVLSIENESDGNQDGEIIFNFEKTFETGGAFKHIDFGDFVSVPKFSHYRSLPAFIEYREKTKPQWYHYTYYGVIYINSFMTDFKIYLNSFNTDSVQNKNYERQVEAVINNGIFNFQSGRIALKSSEQVRAWGAWDGSVVMDIVEGFLETLRGWGLNVASITDYTSGYASLKHTGTGIANYKKLILGAEDKSGITLANKPYPEICVDLDSKSEGYGITMGSIFNPNRSMTRVYGVWNKTNGAETIMNSGFIDMVLRNDTNNWVSLGVGRAYGIFNDMYGVTTINGFTKKEINVKVNYYGLNELIEKLRFDTEKANETGKLLGNIAETVNGWLDELTGWKDSITSKTCYGFHTFSTQKILYNFTGGATIVYTNSFAVANGSDRSKVGDKYDGINFGDSFEIARADFEADWSAFNFNNNSKDEQNMKSLIPVNFYFGLFEKDASGNRKGDMINYHASTHQKIINPLNVLLEEQGSGVVDGLAGSALSSMGNAFNNIAFSSWIGEDYQDRDDVFATLIEVIFREVKQSITNIFK